MSQLANVRPEEVRNFEGKLNRSTAGIHESLDLLRMDLSQLGEDWQDQEYLRFCEEFDEVLRTLQTFVSHSQEFSAFLLRKAEAARKYLEQR